MSHLMQSLWSCWFNVNKWNNWMCNLLLEAEVMCYKLVLNLKTSVLIRLNQTEKLQERWTWTHLNSPECTWTHLNAPECTWTHLNAPELTWMHLNAPERTSWLLSWSSVSGLVFLFSSTIINNNTTFNFTSSVKVLSLSSPDGGCDDRERLRLNIIQHVYMKTIW